MKNNITKIFIVLVILVIVTSCSSEKISHATVLPEPTFTKTAVIQLPTVTETKIQTAIVTPDHTLTPTLVPTTQFFITKPTTEATAENCTNLDKICVSGLTIELSGLNTDDFEVTISYPGNPGTTFQCPKQAVLINFDNDNMAPVFCNRNEISMVSVGLTELTVTINWEDGSLTKTLYPDYELSSPRGKGCNPECLIGFAEIIVQ